MKKEQDKLGQRGPLEVGRNAQGYDVTFYGATSGVFWRWDASADSTLLDGGTVFVKAVASGDGGITVASDGMVKDPESDTEAGYIEIQVGNVTYQIPFYAKS